ncbi:peptide-binding protein [Alisedimentitalea sp. MJ-SS2]|uniref:COG3650 family protein n=1 Tax=Aliisedimentitalea sp. MJ-SS2 TaxID=3049795 RepID=UPI0029145582|nr:peptide-binding protein [Alisedimentitalea sp. MJ-SS2]MDU8927856.1 peptide-binding protein [Alisedimentitalea sp. MJ-SS2]
MKNLVFVLLLLLPGFARADSFPALYDVTGVAAHDTLNVRSDSHAGAAKLGELAHDASDVEVIRVQSGWGLVNLGEVSGWASLHYLQRQESGDYVFSRHFACHGTEPFWSLKVTQGLSAKLSQPDAMDINYHVGLVQTSFNHTNRHSLTGTSPEGGLYAVLKPVACSDGMSDSQYGIEIDILLDGSHISGCCSLVSH